MRSRGRSGSCSSRKRRCWCVFDDIQWGEDAFLDLVEQAGLLCAGPVLLLCLARPELDDRRPSWPVALRLEPLGRGDVEQLLPASVPAGLRERIAHAAGGNPLFVTEMVAMAAGGGDEIAVPATLKALLAARLDQLESAERGVLERGAVEGEVFHRGAVQALGPSEAPVGPRLAALVRRELIRPDRPLLPGDDGFRFCHLLIRDAAYEALPKATRAELHERFARWLDQFGGELVERDELVGYHLQQAHRYLEELGASGERDRSAGRAGRRLPRLGRPARDGSRRLPHGRRSCSNARSRSAFPTRASACSSRSSSAWPSTRPDGPRRRRRSSTRTVEAATAPRGARHWRLVRSFTSRTARLSSDPEVGGAGDDPGRGGGDQRRSRRSATRSGWPRPSCSSATRWRAPGAARRASRRLERALAHAQAAGATGIRRLIVGGLANRICLGPMPVEEGIGRLEELLGANRDDRVLEAVIMRQLAFELAMAGRFDEARAHLEASTPVLDEVNLTDVSWAIEPLASLARRWSSWATPPPPSRT